VTALFGRVCRLEMHVPTTGDKLFVVETTPASEGLRVHFDIRRQTGKNARAKIVITNLAKENRLKLQAGIPFAVSLYAGYAGEIEQIFAGQIDRCWNARERTEWETHLEFEDGKDARDDHLSAVLGQSSKDAWGEHIVGEIGKSGVRPGNALAAIKAAKKSADVVKKVVIHGPKQVELTKALESMDLEHSIVNGELQVVPKGGILSNNVALLSPDTGLIGSPEVGKKDFVKVRCLIAKNLVEQRGIVLDSASIRGLFRIEKVTYKGDTRGREWHADLELSSGVPLETEDGDVADAAGAVGTGE